MSSGNTSPGANKNAKGWVKAAALAPTIGTYQDPLKLGGAYLWVDGTGKLRINATKPGSDTAGTVVGTQT